MEALYDNKYEFQKDLGAGGFGKVFLAKELVSGRLVAIKELNEKDSDNQNDIIHEIQQVSKFNHSNIVSYYHHFNEDDILYLVMEYCEKGTLDKQKLTLDEKIDYIKQVAIALGEVHKKKLVHHDIKPNNILLTANNKIKISDFGIANRSAGTRAYMSPEMLNWENTAVYDERVDIYALGVTLMELLTGINPFFYKNKDEIEELHNSKKFPIENLLNWQQEVILKAINKIPELRFQTMAEFTEALELRQVPIFLNKQSIIANSIAQKMELLLKSKKWAKVFANLSYLQNNFPESVNVLKVLGKYYLLQNNISTAKHFYDAALAINPRLDIQKELGIINIGLKNYAIAISMLSDHLHRNASDMEAYNLLLQCYYETNRYEAGIDLAKTILSVEKNNPIISNNYYLCHIMLNMPETILPDTVLKQNENPFINYNMNLCYETPLSHNYSKKPSLKSKLLFADYRFSKLQSGVIYSVNEDGIEKSYKNFIIKVGRGEFEVNDIQLSSTISISRRHCILINAKDDAWLYDLESTGTFVNEMKVKNKLPIIGLNVVAIANDKLTITTDNTKLL